MSNKDETIAALRAERDRFERQMNDTALGNVQKQEIIDALRAENERLKEERVTPSCGNVFADIGFTAEDYAAKLQENERLRAALETIKRYRDHDPQERIPQTEGAIDGVIRAALEDRKP